ncbi:GNAT family N-acetyltransferase [Fulvivirga sp. M361]|uniref:GNAT family N-acetyltransferase n=1 Tax=Fulvivirga sp. M361 TaxID=2594266 RepID=UPI00117BC3AD|nr:GNAT family N-acetyltransferase [Fulvivirga sp. M361]TRX55949.1 GNAT family N-acetyltransferase [Fulvivirga sp. M361]
MDIEVRLIETDVDLKKAFAIREQVFIREQNIDRSDEYDEFEETSYHFLALVEGVPAGTCRWRKTAEGAKLERFATLSNFRKIGVGSQLLQKAISHISAQVSDDRMKMYLNAQVTAMPLYAKLGFTAEGQRFLECEIEHQKMSREIG